MNEDKKYTSHAKWPNGEISVDSHDTREQAQAVCDLLRQNGFGGDRKIFPISTWVEPHEQSYDVLNNGKIVATLWACSPERAIALFRAAHKQTPKILHKTIKLGYLVAVPRLHDES